MEKKLLSSQFSIMDLLRKYKLSYKKIAGMQWHNYPKVKYKNKILKNNDKLELYIYRRWIS